MNKELAGSLTEFEARWKPGVITLQGEAREAGDAVQVAVDALRGTPPQQIIEALRSIPGAWNVHSWCSGGEHMVVISLAKHDLPIWEQANSTEFDVRIEAYQNDMSACRLEIASSWNHKAELLRVVTNLALVAKLSA